MKVEIVPIKPQDKPRLINLMQYYFYESSAFDGEDPQPDGRFYVDPEYINQYWQTPGWEGHFICLEDNVIGFVLVEAQTLVAKEGRELSDLFILTKYRRLGIGTAIVNHFIQPETGQWEVHVAKGDELADAFWQAQFKNMGAMLSQRFDDLDEWDGSVFLLDTGSPGVDTEALH